MLRFFRIFFWVCFVILTLYIVLSLRPFKVNGDSMQPAYNDGQILLIDRISTRINPLKRWENIVFRDMNNNWEKKVKRVIGLPGETIEIVGGKIIVEEKEIEENYLQDNTHTCLPWACTDLTSHVFSVPEKSYFVLGDNRSVSRDSRGCKDITDCQNQKPVYIPSIEIIGRVIFAW